MGKRESEAAIGMEVKPAAVDFLARRPRGMCFPFIGAGLERDGFGKIRLCLAFQMVSEPARFDLFAEILAGISPQKSQELIS